VAQFSSWLSLVSSSLLGSSGTFSLARAPDAAAGARALIGFSFRRACIGFSLGRHLFSHVLQMRQQARVILLDLRTF
jgi:hypothetical protein